MSMKIIEFEQGGGPDGNSFRVMLKSDMDDEDAIRLMRAVFIGCVSVMPLVTEALQQEGFDALMRRLLNGDKGFE